MIKRYALLRYYSVRLFFLLKTQFIEHCPPQAPSPFSRHGETRYRSAYVVCQKHRTVLFEEKKSIPKSLYSFILSWCKRYAASTRWYKLSHFGEDLLLSSYDIPLLCTLQLAAQLLWLWTPVIYIYILYLKSFWVWNIEIHWPIGHRYSVRLKDGRISHSMRL